MKKYVAPVVQVDVIELELSFAAGSAVVSPLGYNDNPLQESWEEESMVQEFEW